jgi:hypothetical protein
MPALQHGVLSQVHRQPHREVLAKPFGKAEWDSK